MNPAFVVRGWAKGVPVLEINDKHAKAGEQFRFGYETKDGKTNLVLWLDLKSDEPVNLSLRQGNQ